MTADTTAAGAIDEVAILELVDDLFATSDAADVAAFLGRKFDLGLSRVHFPVGEGGLGVSPKLQPVVEQAIADRQGPVLRWTAGPGMCAPTIVSHGTEEQKRRWLRPLFAGEEVWCQLFSEPGAGSDVAALSTRAVRDGDHWVVNGQKVWTSAAHHARWGLLLARTNPDAPKHNGITAFVVDVHQSAVEVRPLRQMTGNAEFNEVYFTDALIPDEHRIGAVDAGWRVAVTTLMNERVTIGGRQPLRGEGPIKEAVDIWRSRDLHDPVLRDELAKLWIQSEVLRLTNIRSAALRTRGTPGPEGSIAKLSSAELGKRIANLTVALLGADAMLYPGYDSIENVQDDPSSAFLRAQALSIGGGTSEIMRNIIGERTLGLPGDVRVDRDVPWNEIPRGLNANELEERNVAKPFVIDAHNHVGGLGDTGIGNSRLDEDARAALDTEVETRLAVMRARGVDQAVVIASHGYLRPHGIVDTRRVNDAIGAYAATAPESFPAAIGIVEPLYGEVGLEELDRAHQELGLAGISFHTRFQGVSIDSPWVRRFLERMGELGLVPFVHAVGESAAEALWKIDVLAADFPDLPMVILDAFSTFEQSSFVPHVAERRPALVFDTALAHGLSFVAALVSRCGASRLVFGSDLYSGPGEAPGLSNLLDDLLTWDLPEAERLAILAGNIRRVVGI